MLKSNSELNIKNAVEMAVSRIQSNWDNFFLETEFGSIGIEINRRPNPLCFKGKGIYFDFMKWDERPYTKWASENRNYPGIWYINFYIHPRMSYKFLQLIVGAALSHALISYVYSCDEWNVADVPIWMLYRAVETLVSVKFTAFELHKEIKSFRFNNLQLLAMNLNGTYEDYRDLHTDRISTFMESAHCHAYDSYELINEYMLNYNCIRKEINPKYLDVLYNILALQLNKEGRKKPWEYHKNLNDTFKFALNQKDDVFTDVKLLSMAYAFITDEEINCEKDESAKEEALDKIEEIVNSASGDVSPTAEMLLNMVGSMVVNSNSEAEDTVVTNEEDE